MLVLPPLGVVDLDTSHWGAWAIGIADIHRELHHSSGSHNLGAIAFRALDVVLAQVDDVVPLYDCPKVL